MRGGDDHRVEVRPVGQSFAPVTQDDMSVTHALGREVRARGAGELRSALQRPHFARQPCQQGGLVAETRADLQDTLVAAQRECLHHGGHE
jgi:hypothetical protein